MNARQPHPAPQCVECAAPLDASMTVWPLGEDGQRRWIDTGHPCGHVQLDTVLDPDSDTIGQMTAAQAAATIRLVAAVVGGSLQLDALAERVEHYDGDALCPLCTVWPHDTVCPLRARSDEVMD